VRLTTDDTAAASQMSSHPSTSGMVAATRHRLRRDLANWRLFLVRWLTSGLAVVVTVALLPGLRFTSWSWGEFLLIGLVFGLLNALVKPVIQFFTLRYLVASYGVVVILINSFLLVLLSWLLGGEIAARGPIPLLLGGAVVGALGLFLDTLAGTAPPIFDTPSTMKHDDRENAPGPVPGGPGEAVS
jgi:putative membrane protein